MSYKGGLFEAIKSLQPYAEFGLSNNDITTLEWYDDESVVPIPSIADIEAEHERLKAEYENNTYQRKRAAEYPPLTDYLDGIVKGDNAQIQSYIDACLAVKEKYPKGNV